MGKKIKIDFILLILSLCLFVPFLSSCMRSQSQGVTIYEFIPPTLVATAVRAPTIDPFRSTEKPKSNCVNSLSFIDDATVPDGSIFAPGEEIVKRWRVENSGTCEWTNRYSVRIVSGQSINAETKQKITRIAPGSEGEIEIVFTAPKMPGAYFSGWRAYNDKGEPFGDDFFIDILIIEGYISPTPTTTPSPTTPSSFTGATNSL